MTQTNFSPLGPCGSVGQGQNLFFKVKGWGKDQDGLWLPPPTSIKFKAGYLLDGESGLNNPWILYRDFAFSGDPLTLNVGIANFELSYCWGSTIPALGYSNPQYPASGGNALP